MRTKCVIIWIAVVLFAGVVSAITCESPSWKCTGTANCTAEQADACRSFRGLLGGWTCEGECYKSDATGTVAVCQSPAGLFDTCTYGGSSACSGTIQRRDCATATWPWWHPEFGTYCTGSCTGEWTVKYSPGVINNCT